MVKSTKMPADQGKTAPEPWQSWGDTARYIAIVVVIVVLSALLVWLTRGAL